MRWICSLHYVYKPRINSALQAFTESWNNHAVSTEGNRTPNQLFVEGALERHRIPQYPNPASHQQQTAAVQLQRNSTNAVSVPQLKFQPCRRVKDLLSCGINPLDPSSDFGCTLYYSACRIVGHHLSSGCTYISYECTMNYFLAEVLYKIVLTTKYNYIAPTSQSQYIAHVNVIFFLCERPDWAAV